MPVAAAHEIDDDESKHALALAEHGHQETPGAWVSYWSRNEYSCRDGMTDSSQ